MRCDNNGRLPKRLHHQNSQNRPTGDQISDIMGIMDYQLVSHRAFPPHISQCLMPANQYLPWRVFLFFPGKIPNFLQCAPTVGFSVQVSVCVVRESFLCIWLSAKQRGHGCTVDRTALTFYNLAKEEKKRRRRRRRGIGILDLFVFSIKSPSICSAFCVLVLHNTALHSIRRCTPARETVREAHSIYPIINSSLLALFDAMN